MSDIPKNSPATVELFIMDSKTPLNVNLSAFYKRSFAFHTVKDRMPVILTKLIDYLVRDKEKIIKNYGDEASEDLKYIIGEISKFKYEIQTNKPIEKLSSPSSDVDIYNTYMGELSNTDGVPRYFTTTWLFVECYMYRRIKCFFENTTLDEFDYYRNNKCLSYIQSLPAIKGLANYFITTIDVQNSGEISVFIKLLKLNLWGNKCDLSISAGADNAQSSDPLSSSDSYNELIISDHSCQIWEALNNPEAESTTINFINDNAGYEMFTDLCLADYLITHGLAEKIVFNVKKIPWFISDMLETDIKWLLFQLSRSEENSLATLGKRWTDYFASDKWQVETDDFWTLPFDFARMNSVSPHLYERLSHSKLLIFKGDLNYRKLFGDINWDPNTPMETALRGFKPAPLCTLRTLKADIIVGLETGVAEHLEKTVKSWLVSGEYGVIQFCE